MNKIAIFKENIIIDEDDNIGYFKDKEMKGFLEFLGITDNEWLYLDEEECKKHGIDEDSENALINKYDNFVHKINNDTLVVNIKENNFYFEQKGERRMKEKILGTVLLTTISQSESMVLYNIEKIYF